MAKFIKLKSISTPLQHSSDYLRIPLQIPNVIVGRFFSFANKTTRHGDAVPGDVGMSIRICGA